MYVKLLIPDVTEIGLDMHNPAQPASIDPARLKHKYGRDICFWGSMDEQHTLLFGTPEGVQCDIEQRVATLDYVEGLSLSHTDQSHLDTPLENF